MRSLSACPVCQSDRIRYDFTAPTTRGGDDRQWKVDRCEDCSHGFMNPQPSWEELLPYYSASYQAYSPSHGLNASDDQIVEAARKSRVYRHVKIEEGERILDVGCGGGSFLRIAGRLGAIVEGVEPSEDGARRARAAGLEVFNGTLENYVVEHGDKRFDLITANHVIEHLPDPIGTLATMKQLLAPGGVVWIAVPNAECWFNRTLKGRWHSADFPYHLMQFGARSLMLAGERAGLALKSLSTYSMPGATATSIRQVARIRALIPMRLLLKVGVIDSWIAPPVSRRLDSSLRGEAILVEFVDGGEPSADSLSRSESLVETVASQI